MTGDNVIPYEAMSLPTSSGLLVGVRANDQDAWHRFVHLYRPLIYFWCRGAGLQEADAADVSQEVFRAVSRSIARFRRDKPGDTLRGWLRVVTANKVRDFNKLKQRNETVGSVGGQEGADRALRVPAVPDEPSEATLEEETLLLYRQALDLMFQNFEEKSCRAFLRVVIDGQSPTEVAEEMGMTPNSVYLARSRILRLLREELGDLLE